MSDHAEFTHAGALRVSASRPSPVTADESAHVIRPSRPLGLPLPNVSPLASATAMLAIAVSPLGAKGRISDAFCLRELGWVPGTPINVHAAISEVRVMRSQEHGTDGGQRVDRSGHLRLLSPAQSVAGFSVGDRVLMVADLQQESLRVLPTSVLNGLLTDSSEAIAAMMFGDNA